MAHTRAHCVFTALCIGACDASGGDATTDPSTTTDAPDGGERPIAVSPQCPGFSESAIFDLAGSSAEGSFNTPLLAINGFLRANRPAAPRLAGLASGRRRGDRFSAIAVFVDDDHVTRLVTRLRCSRSRVASHRMGWLRRGPGPPACDCSRFPSRDDEDQAASSHIAATAAVRRSREAPGRSAPRPPPIPRTLDTPRRPVRHCNPNSWRPLRCAPREVRSVFRKISINAADLAHVPAFL